MENVWATALEKTTADLRALGTIDQRAPIWALLGDALAATRRLNLPGVPREAVDPIGAAMMLAIDLRQVASKVSPNDATKSLRNRCRYLCAAIKSIKTGKSMSEQLAALRGRPDRAGATRRYAAPEPELPVPWYVEEKLAADKENDARLARRKKR